MNIVNEKRSFSINEIAVTVVKKGVRNLHLSVLPPNGKVRVTAPIKMNDEAIRMSIVSRLLWIKKQQAKYLNQERQSKREFSPGESHYFKGENYLLRIKFRSAPAKVEIVNKKYLDLYVKGSSNEKYRQNAIIDWYRHELKKQISPLLEKWEKITKIKVKECRIRRMKTKWGTCNRDAKRIWLNLELAKKPVHCLEYILVHEMVHILEKHHTDFFKEYLSKFMPKWKSYREELNKFILSYEKWDY